MARPDKIRAARLEARVRTLAAEGKSTREIADVLTAEGCPIGYVAVSRFVREEIGERRDAAKSVAAQDAVATVPLVTEGLRKLAALALKRADDAEDDSAAARLIAAGTGAFNALHRVTVGEDGPKTGADLAAELGAILDQRRRRTE